MKYFGFRTFTTVSRATRSLRLAAFAAVLTSCLCAMAAWLLPAVSAQSSTVTSEKNAIETPRQVLDGSAKFVQHYNPGQVLRLTLALQPPHMEQEEQFVQELQTKGSPEYHHFLTAEEWTKRFDPSQEDEQAVVEWATSQGLTITHRFPNRLLVDVAAPAATLEKAFNVTVNNYQLGNTTFFSNDRDPQIPFSLRGILHSVQGLNSLQRMYPSRSNAIEPISPDYSPGPPYAEAGSAYGDGSRTLLKQVMKAKTAKLKNGTTSNFTNGFLDPTDIYNSNAYNYDGLQHLGHCCNPLGNSGSSPPESSIAIATFGTQLLSDIGGFQAQYPYLAYNVNLLFIDGTPACCDSEGTLDAEWSTATSNSFGASQDTAHIWVYEGANFNNSTFTDMYNFMLTDGHARVFTTSWSCTEFYGCSSSTMDSRHNIFNSMLGQGWTLFTASGDRGAFDDCSHLAVSYPASDPDLIGVGGTYLQLFNDGTYDYEVAWQGGTSAGSCGNNNGGSGGGCSAYYAAPAYQGPSPACGTGSRSVPDVSLNAAYGQNYYFNGSLSGTGGTSIASPEMAGFAAQENAYLLYLSSIISGGLCNGHGCAPMGAANTYLYYFGFNSSYPTHYPFYDITSGCNSSDVGTGYCAGTGYDVVTGWGTSNMLQLAWAINAYNAGDFGAPNVSFSGPATNTWYNSDQVVSWSVHDTSGDGLPRVGVSGFSQGWDSVIDDSRSASTPGSGDGFYSGPQYANSASGCLDLTGALCAGSVGQGWHRAYVRAWDNSGSNRVFSHGPIGYDTIAPVTSSKLTGTKSGSIFVSAVADTLTATDFSPGSGVKNTVYQINGGTVTTYTGPFHISANGNYTIRFHSTDVAGNVEGTETTSFTIARWLPETSGTAANLRGISCVSATNCEVVGAGGLIRGTTNGGSTWSAQTSGTTNTLNGVSCVIAFCVVVGNSGTISVTTNSGGTWTAKSSGTTQNLLGVSCASTSFCVAVGAGGTIRATTNGGSTWTSKTSGTTNNLNAISCSSTSVCKAVGAGGTIRATTNGGATWTAQTSGTTNALNGVHCRSTSNFCVGAGIGGKIVVTTNGGTTWSTKPSGTTQNLNAVNCSSTTVCRAVGNAGTVGSTTNGGGTWSNQPASTTINLFGVNTQSVTLAYAVGNTGTILKQ